MENAPLLELKNLYRTRYVSHADLADFVAKHHLVAPSKYELNRKRAKLLLTLQLTKLKHMNATTGELYKLLNNRSRLNKEFIRREQKKPYQIEGNNLDPEQITAVVAAEDAELILAPAGSGKTASLLAKLDYLADVLKIPPNEILVIAFTNKVVAELKDRICQQGIEIRTFHSLGNKIIQNNLKGYKLVTEQKINRFFHSTLKNLCASSPAYAAKYDNYIGKNNIDDDSAAFLNLISHPHSGKQDEAKSLESLFIAILGLQKSERASLTELRRRIEGITNNSSRTKATDFYELYAPIVTNYEAYLKQNHLYDFADMLNLATDLVNGMPTGSLKYQYILVDEAQDLSISKQLLLKAILDKCAKVKLFAVGDDWQSIYRFAGSNLSVLDNFEQIFERTTYRGLIQLTYRFGQPTARISNNFIQRNPHQSRKKVIPHTKQKTPIIVRLNMHKQSRTTPQDYETINQELNKLYKQYGEKIFNKHIQIISRYNHDIFRVVLESSKSYKNAVLTNLSEANLELEWYIEDADKKIKIPFCSMHKAKGITRDIIIVINLNQGIMGMPAARENHPIAEVLLTKLDPYPHAEERRLFYVAITRAREQTILISDSSRISPFVFEINPKLKGSGVKVCPKCHRGILEEHRSRKTGKIYYSCTNKSGGCHYTRS